jgi:hypothetical protein
MAVRECAHATESEKLIFLVENLVWINFGRHQKMQEVDVDYKMKIDEQIVSSMFLRKVPSTTVTTVL